MSSYNITVTVSLDEADTRVDVDDLRKALATGLVAMYGPDSWAGDVPPITRLAVDAISYDIATGEFEGSRGGLTAEEIVAMEEGKTIQVIKSVRERLHLGLGEAKAIVDRYRAEYMFGRRPTSFY